MQLRWTGIAALALILAAVTITAVLGAEGMAKAILGSIATLATFVPSPVEKKKGKRDAK